MFKDDAISTNECIATQIPDCLFSMDVAQIIISFNQFEETLDGFSMTFVERGNDDEIIQSFTCTHGNAVEGEHSTLKYIEPSP